ncbi:MAG TPA: DMT family transporter [Clostridia bacterium]|nr:DMT family transporter [Clostridia bacterium]
MKKSSNGYILAIASALSFSLVSIVGKIIMTRGINPSILIFWQYTAVLIGLALYFYFAKVSIRIETPYILLGGLFSVAANFSFYTSMNLTGAGLATLFIYFSPVFIALFFSLSGIRQITSSGWLAILLALLGSALTLGIFSGIKIQVLGVIAGLFAGLFYASYNIALDLKLTKINFLIINFYVALQGLILISLFNFTQAIKPWAILPKEILAIVFLGLLGGVLPNFLNFASIRLIGSDKTSVIMSTELPATVLLAFFFLEEKMSLMQILGIVLVLASVLLLKSQEDPCEESLPER